MIIELSLQRLITVSPGSSSAEIRSSYLLKGRDAKHFDSSNGKGTTSFSTALFRFLSPETLLPPVCLIGFFNRLPTTSRASTSAMAGMHSTRPPREGLELVRFGSSRFSHSVLLPGFVR